MTWFRWAVPLALSVGCASTSPVPEPVLECALPAQGPDPAPFLWSVTCPDRPGHLHLVGSVHVGRPGADELPDPIVQALAASEVVVQEANVPGLLGSTVLLFQSGAFSWFEKTELRPQTWELLEPRLSELGMDRRSAERLRPWALYLAVEVSNLQQAGYDPDHGVDATLKRLAKAADPPKQLRYMESAASQIRLFADLDPAQQERLLVQALQTDPAEAERLMDAYRGGDARTLCEMTLGSSEDEENFPGLEDRILHDRNRHFAQYALDLIGSPSPAMIVAGAAHMVGPTGVPNLLAEAGCTVRRAP